MKKILSLALVVLLITSVSVAEKADDISIEGEWYVTGLYTEKCYSASVDEEGNFHILLYDESEQIIHTSGDFYDNDGEYKATLTPYVFAENAQLFHTFLEDGMFVGYLFIQDEESWKCYDFDNVGKYLVYDGKMLPAPNSKGEKSEYHQAGNTIFLIRDDSYVKGSIIPYGSKAFAFVMDVDPVEQEYGNGLIVSWGYPMYFYFSTDLT